MRATVVNSSYAALFAVVLPVALFAWAVAGNGAHLPPVPAAPFGPLLAAFGAALLVTATAAFIAETHKLPVSTDRPPAAVVTGPYRLFSDPLYVGFCAAVAGVFAMAEYAFGFWIVAPALIAATVALATGYENHRRPKRPSPALFDWPESAARPPTARERSSIVLNVFWITAATLIPAAGLAWVCAVSSLAAVCAAVIVRLGGAGAGELRKGMMVYLTGSIIVLVCLYGAPNGRIALGVPIGLALAAFVGAAGKRPVSAGVLANFLVLAAMFFADFAGGLKMAGGPALGALFGYLLPPLHRVMLHVSERIANSWSSLRLGPVRIINYALYPFLAALLGAVIFEAASPGPAVRNVLVIALCGVAGAGLWGQLIENTGRLARPFGYFGAIMGVTIGIAIVRLTGGGSLVTIAAAASLAAPWVQAIGRLRCLVQGCCHGRTISDPDYGIVYRREHSRVVRIAGLGGVPVHATPLYSIYANLILGAVVMRMAMTGMPAALIAGVYLLGAGAARFVEESYRGEPQTRMILDLKIYQWLAIGEALAGALITVLPSQPLMLHALGGPEVAAAFGAAALAGIAMGVDFPGSQRRFSQLTPR